MSSKLHLLTPTFSSLSFFILKIWALKFCHLRSNWYEQHSSYFCLSWSLFLFTFKHQYSLKDHETHGLTNIWVKLFVSCLISLNFYQILQELFHFQQLCFLRFHQVSKFQHKSWKDIFILFKRFCIHWEEYEGLHSFKLIGLQKECILLLVGIHSVF